MFPTLILTAFAFILVRIPPLGVAILLTLPELGNLDLAGTKARVFYPVFYGLSVVYNTLFARPQFSLSRLHLHPVTHILVFFVVFILYGFDSFTEDDIVTLKLFGTTWVLPVLFLTICVRLDSDQKLFLRGLVLGVTLQGLFEWVKWVENPSTEIIRLGLATSGHSRMLVSAWFSCATLVAATLALRSTKRFGLIFHAALALLCLYLLLLTGTTSSFASFSISFYMLTRQVNRFYPALIMFCLIVLLLFFQNIESSMTVRLQALINDPWTHMESRIDIYSQGFLIDFPMKPILGTGLFASGNELPSFGSDALGVPIQLSATYRQNYENIYLTFLVETGVLGCFVLVLIFSRAFLLTRSSSSLVAKSSPTHDLVFALWVGSILRSFFYGSVLGAMDLIVFAVLLFNDRSGWYQPRQIRVGTNQANRGLVRAPIGLSDPTRTECASSQLVECEAVEGKKHSFPSVVFPTVGNPVRMDSA